MGGLSLSSQNEEVDTAPINTSLSAAPETGDELNVVERVIL